MSQTETNQAVLDQEPVTHSEPIARYVVVGVHKNRYGITTDSTVELMGSNTARITRVPHSPEYISGVINHRGSIIPVIDSRKLLGFQTNKSEVDALVSMLAQREQDHIDWLNELRRCVREGAAFTKALDPNMCAFGKWYNELMGSASKLNAITKGDASLKSLFEYFKAPHARIHSIGKRVLELAQHGEQEKACAVIQEAWDTDLKAMQDLFGRAKETIKKTHVSMMIITELGSRKAAMLVDAVYTVKDVSCSSIEALPESADNHQFLKGLVHEDDGGYVLITDLEAIYDAACPSEAEQQH
ncbi:MAG: chemotaxis protein CheW [Phycisphaerales bacterium]|nr:chemotaxis protein CheW [Phycisphaerales bacterium]